MQSPSGSLVKYIICQRNVFVKSYQDIITTKGADAMPLPNTKIYTTEDIFALPEGERAELIDGRLYNMAPPSRIHQEILMELSATLRDYIRKNTGNCKVYPAPFAVFLGEDNKNYVEPDISVICDKNKLTDKGCNGAPDFVIEIVSPSSQRMDYQIKLFKYRTAGVKEYWIVNPSTQTTTVYGFEHDENSGQYSFEETIKAGLFKDLEIRIADLL